jgi:hypothetical protein
MDEEEEEEETKLQVEWEECSHRLDLGFLFYIFIRRAIAISL